MFEQKKKKVSIIIPSWFEPNQNGKYGIDETFGIAEKCIERLIKITPKELYELIIIDNGSTLSLSANSSTSSSATASTSLSINSLTSKRIINKDLNNRVIEYFSKTDILIRNQKNLGFAPAINQGINLARGEFIITLNNDILLWHGWLETMIKDFEKNENLFDPSIGLLMPALVKDKINFWEAIKLKKENIDMQTNAGKFSVKAEFGSLWMGRKKLLMEVAKNRDGYQILDENFKCGMGEDRWLYREIRMLGKETYRTHNLRVLHVGNVTISKIPDRKKYTFKNREYLDELKKRHNVE